MLNFDDKIVACICEGSAEEAIMEILLDDDLLIFNELLDDKIIRERSAKSFENKYLRKGFDKGIAIIRILDSRKENFKLSKLYEEKVSVINIVTPPEIEMLIIHSENKYEDFRRSGLRPSIYCKTMLKLTNIKSYKFIKTYFENSEKLVKSIKTYRQKIQAQRGEYYLSDLLKI